MIRIGGAAGMGLDSSGAGFAQALVRGGLHIFGVPDFYSRIRGDRIPIGIFHRATPGPTFEALDPVLQAGPPLVKRLLEKLAAAQVESLLARLRQKRGASAVF